MLNYQRAKENRARRDFLRERCYLWGIILRGLGERLNGIQEVSGSIPLISTKNPSIKNRRIFYPLRKQWYISFIIQALTQQAGRRGGRSCRLQNGGGCGRRIRWARR